MLKTTNYDGAVDGRTSAPTEPSASLAKLGIDPSRLLPYLAAEGRPLPSIEIAGAGTETASGPAAEIRSKAGLVSLPDDAPFKSRFDADSLHNFTAPLPPWLQATATESVSPSWASAVTSAGSPLRQAQSADPLEGFNSSPNPSRPQPLFSQIDPAELARSLASFSPEILPSSEGVSGIDRVFSATSPTFPVRGGPNGGLDPSESSLPSIEATFPQSGRTDFDFDATDSVSRLWTSSAGSNFETSGTGGSGPTSGLDARLARAVERLERIAEQLDQLSPMSRSGPSRPFRGRIDV